MDKKNIDPEVEANQILQNYLTNTGWAKEMRRSVSRMFIKIEDREQQFRMADKKEEEAEGSFAGKIDELIKDRSNEAKEILEIIYRKLYKRTNVSYLGKRMLSRIKEKLM